MMKPSRRGGGGGGCHRFVLVPFVSTVRFSVNMIKLLLIVIQCTTGCAASIVAYQGRVLVQSCSSQLLLPGPGKSA